MTIRELELSDAHPAACTASLERRKPQIAIRRTLAAWRHTPQAISGRTALFSMPAGTPSTQRWRGR